MEEYSNAVFEGNGFLWVILIFLFFLGFNGGGLFGNNNNSNSFGMSQVERDTLMGNASVEKSVMQSQYDTLLGFKDISAQMAECCCKITTSIHAEGEATRALITQNRIADLEKELSLAQVVASNATQTQTILNALGTYTPK